jgi:hypothetical protein
MAGSAKATWTNLANFDRYSARQMSEDTSRSVRAAPLDSDQQHAVCFFCDSEDAADHCTVADSNRGIVQPSIWWWLEERKFFQDEKQVIRNTHKPHPVITSRGENPLSEACCGRISSNCMKNMNYFSGAFQVTNDNHYQREEIDSLSCCIGSNHLSLLMSFLPCGVDSLMAKEFASTQVAKIFSQYLFADNCPYFFVSIPVCKIA